MSETSSLPKCSLFIEDFPPIPYNNIYNCQSCGKLISDHGHKSFYTEMPQCGPNCIRVDRIGLAELSKQLEEVKALLLKQQAQIQELTLLKYLPPKHEESRHDQPSCYYERQRKEEQSFPEYREHSQNLFRDKNVISISGVYHK